MLGVMLLGIFLTLVFYYVIQWFKDQRQTAAPVEVADDSDWRGRGSFRAASQARDSRSHSRDGDAGIALSADSSARCDFRSAY